MTLRGVSICPEEQNDRQLRRTQDKKEKEAREKAEAAMLTGQRCFERDCVKSDPVAHKEYLRLTKLLSTIQKTMHCTEQA